MVIFACYGKRVAFLRTEFNVLKLKNSRIVQAGIGLQQNEAVRRTGYIESSGCPSEHPEQREHPVTANARRAWAMGRKVPEKMKPDGIRLPHLLRQNLRQTFM